MSQSFAWRSAQKILCVRLDHFGDILMATPALRALKESLQGSSITLLAAPHAAAVARYIPEIDDTIDYAAPWMKSSAAHEVATDLDMIMQLRACRFDAAVIFTTYSQSPLPAAMLCLLAGIPLRLAHCHENPYQLLTHWLPDPEPQQCIRHEVQRQLDLVAAVGGRTSRAQLSFAVRDTDRDWARGMLDACDIDSAGRWILIHPGCSAASRRYPPTQWAQATASLTGRLGYPVAFSGSESEAALVDDIMQMTWRLNAAAKLQSLAGLADLGQLGALISLSSLVITNNTGPAHLAAALCKPIVDLYALTNPQHAPWMTRSRVLFQDVPCRFCYKSVCPQIHNHCLTRIDPMQVVAAAVDLLEDHSAPYRGTGAAHILAHAWPAAPATKSTPTCAPGFRESG